MSTVEALSWGSAGVVVVVAVVFVASLLQVIIATRKAAKLRGDAGLLLDAVRSTQGLVNNESEVLDFASVRRVAFFGTLSANSAVGGKGFQEVEAQYELLRDWRSLMGHLPLHGLREWERYTEAMRLLANYDAGAASATRLLQSEFEHEEEAIE